MIQLTNISLSFGGQVIFNNLNWFIRARKRIGLIGPNGAGKTTLLKVITKQQAFDSGDISFAGQVSIGYLEQNMQEEAIERTILEEAQQAFATILELEKEIDRIHHEIQQATDFESEDYLKKLDTLAKYQAQLTAHDAHRTEDQAATVLMGLGFEPSDLDRSMATFSGGWRMRVALAKLLLQEPDLLLLDEPTNHLDIKSISWLENYLKTYNGTVILVSHDRYFLDRMVDTIAALGHGQLIEYAGNYAFYLEERENRKVLQRAAYENQQAYIKQTERFIERFRYKNTKAKQVQSRIKALEKLELIPPPDEDEASIQFKFPTPESSGRIVLDLSEFSKTYTQADGTPLEVFKHARGMKIERGDKIALVGKNGAGKSTLARMLLGTEPFEGERELGYKVELTYFAQHQAESLDVKDTVLSSLQKVATGESDTQIRSLLGAFLFQGDDVYKSISVLSGGERSRVALARTLLKPANFLILDEPTNHLDIQSIGILIEALRQYTGTFVIVSHDRHFLDQIVNKVWYVQTQKIQELTGTYADFLWKVEQEHHTSTENAPIPQKKDVAKEVETLTSSSKKTKEQKRLEAEARKTLKTDFEVAKKQFDAFNWEEASALLIEKMIAYMEEEIHLKETLKTELEVTLSDPKLYENLSEFNKTTNRYQDLKETLASLYEQWEYLAELV